MEQKRLSIIKLAGFAMGLFAVQTFWGFTWATLPLYLKGLSGSNAVTGIMLSTTGMAGLVLPVLAGSFSDRINTRWGRRSPLIAAGWVTVCAMLLCLPAIHSLTLALPVMIIAYTGFFAAISPYFSLLPDIVPLEQRSMASGVMFLVGGTGNLAYLLFAARFWDTDPLLPFLWTVGAIILSCVLLFISVREREGEVPSRLSAGLMGEALRNRNVVRFFLAMILWWTGLWMASSFFIITYRELFHVDTQLSVRAFFVLNASFVLFALPGSLLGNRLGLKRVTSFMLLLVAGSFFYIPFSGGYEASYPYLIIAGASFGSVLAVSYPFFLNLVPKEKTAGFVGLYMACQNGTILIGPALGGIISDHLGYKAIFPCSSLFILAGFLVLLNVRTNESPGNSR